MSGIIGESPPAGVAVAGRHGNQRGYGRYGRVTTATSSRYCSDATSGPSIAVSMRDAFVPFSGKTSTHY